MGHRWCAGAEATGLSDERSHPDRGTHDQLMPEVQAELHRLARSYLARDVVATPFNLCRQWVALDGSRLVTHGDELATGRAAGLAAGVDRPLLTHLAPEGERPFSGWYAVHQLTFTQVHPYSDRDTGTTVPIVLRSGETIADLVASLDIGASYCLFESVYAAELGLDLTTGVSTRFRTANGSFEAYGHEVEIDVPG
jgi:hypothetical protein